MNQHDFFDKQLEKASAWQRERFKLLMDQYKDIKFTDTQRRYLLWLASWDKETIKTFEEIFELFESRVDKTDMVDKAGNELRCLE